VNPREAARLLDIDYRDTMAIGALMPAGQPERIIGVSRYARPPGATTAECAIVVADEWQGRGIGTELMRSLGAAALANGITAFEGWSLADNTRIQGWARRFGFDVRTEPNSGGSVKVTVELATLPV
jgi:acetyltransferase